MKNHAFQTFWNVAEALAQGVYFYQKPIESYSDGCEVFVTGHGEMKMFGSYSYLGLNAHPRINRATIEAINHYGTGAHGARLLAGTLELHKRLEDKIARFKKTEAASVFSSGYLANLSAIAALVGTGDTIVCDKLNHASIVDGCRLSGANLKRFRHNDMNHLEKVLRESGSSNRILVVVDAVFSMDGDIINLPEVSRLCRKYWALLMVDEAHSIGVLGKTGRGIEEHFGLPADSVDIKMGTLSKAIPSAGGYIAGSRQLCEFLNHQARGFIYSGALSPAASAAALAALEIIEDEPAYVAKLQQNMRLFAALLRAAGFSDQSAETPIFPVICGDDNRAREMAKYCQARGIYVQAIPYPVVPKGKSRLRFAVTANHTPDDLKYCVSVLKESLLSAGLTSQIGDERKKDIQTEHLKLAA